LLPPETAGCPETEDGRGSDETLRTVEVRQPFYLATTELTVEQAWKAPDPRSESSERTFDDPRAPHLVRDERHLQSTQRGLGHADPSRKYRLATEEEWEYACRAGTTTPYSTGITIRPDEAAFQWRFAFGPAPTTDRGATVARVGNFAPNRWGLYDTHGGAWEVCVGTNSPPHHVLRGGAWTEHPRELRSARRVEASRGIFYPTPASRWVSDLPAR
jgi:sulfatase modifying factor 1